MSHYEDIVFGAHEKPEKKKTDYSGLVLVGVPLAGGVVGALLNSKRPVTGFGVGAAAAALAGIFFAKWSIEHTQFAPTRFGMRR
jgi:hypothetical protein